MRTSKARFRWNLLNQVFFLAIVGLAIDRGNRQFKKEERRLRSPWYRQHVAERLAVYAVTLTLLAVDWQSALLFVLIPRFFGLWAIAGINYAQHDGCDADDPYNHSRNFVGHAINWALFNNGFHTAHHDSPGVHWSELRDLHEQTVAPKIHPALCQPSLLAYAWKAYVWPGRRLNFDGTPVVLPPPQADDSWIPASHALPAEVSIGAANALRNSTDR